MYTWTIVQLERNTTDGGVITAHWQATIDDSGGDHFARSYGTCSFTPDPTAEDFIPFDQLTEDVVLAWCWENGVDRVAIEAGLDSQLEQLTNPPSLAGLPW